MSNDLNLNQITFQSSIRSKVTRENFTDIQNEFNALRAEVAATIASTASEITSARDNFPNLSDNIHVRKLAGNFLEPTGTAVFETNTPSMKLRVRSGEGVINGIGVDWTSGTSATVTAPSTNPRIDVVVVNTDNSVTIVAGTETAAPAFPDIATTQDQIGAILLRPGTTSLNDQVELFNIEVKQNEIDIALMSTTTIPPGNFKYNNFIFDASITLDVRDSSDIVSLFQREMVSFDCAGNIFITNNAALTSSATASITSSADSGNNANPTNSDGGSGGSATNLNSNITSLAAGKGGNSESSAITGGGGGGGASLIADGGKGGDGDNDGGSGQGSTSPGIFTLFRCSSFWMDGSLINDGGIGQNSGGGGAGGGATFIIADEKVIFETNASLSAAGGDGTARSGGNAGGGGGAGGGVLLIRSASFVDNGVSVDFAGGTGGAGTGTGQNGTNGSAGVLDQALYTDKTTILTDNKIPYNFLGLGHR